MELTKNFHNIDLLPLQTYTRVVGRYSIPAIRKKIERKQWQEGKEYYRAPDHKIWVSISGVEAWVKKASTPALKSTKGKLELISDLTASCAERL